MTTQQIENLLVSEFLKNKYNGLADNDYINEIADMLEHAKQLSLLASQIGDSNLAKALVFSYFNLRHKDLQSFEDFLANGERLLNEIGNLPKDMIQVMNQKYNKKFGLYL